MVLNSTRLILDDHGNNLDTFRISLESFSSFEGPLLLKPVNGQELFFAISYSKLALNCTVLELTNFGSALCEESLWSHHMRCKEKAVGFVL